MKIIVLICSFFLFLFSNAQEYNAHLIPDSLKKDANVVKRDEEYILTIKSPSKYTLYERHVYTVLNSIGSSFANYVTNYDKFSNINSLSGKLFNAFGKEIKHTKKSDWTDNSAYDGFSLFSDARYKENNFFSSEYPYTVEYAEEDEINGTQGFPAWRPQQIATMSVEKSRFTIVAPTNYVVRYKKLNLTSEPVITIKGNQKIYTWEITNIPAKKFEVSSPPLSEITPTVFFAPSVFEVQGFTGDMSTWEGYGKFMYLLIKGRDVLPEGIKTTVHELTGKIKDDKEKIFVLYDFLQKNTRYISIQLGIGGWQPFEASFVAEKKYGDCKALSNYMIALLKEAGITGKYVEIYGGSSPRPFYPDFPCSQFNHVIACVPLNKDTIWLECTSQTVSPGYMGSFTGNRYALLIDENGGHLLHTPVYKLSNNLRVRKVNAIADDQGNLSADITNTYSGLEQDFPHALMNEISKQEREKYLNQMFNFPTYEVLKNSYQEHRGIIPSITETLQIQLNNYANITGKRLFINPNIFGGATGKVSPDTARKYDYIIKDSYRGIDSVEIKIPKGYKTESVPKEVFVDTEFGKYKSSVQIVDDKIIYYRQIEQYGGRFLPTKFNDLVKFYDQVYKSDRNKLVLVKSDE